MNSDGMLKSPRWRCRILDWYAGTALSGWLVAILLLLAGILFAHLPVWAAGVLPFAEFTSDLVFRAPWPIHSPWP